jgi:hypothetical protein
MPVLGLCSGITREQAYSGNEIGNEIVSLYACQCMPISFPERARSQVRVGCLGYKLIKIESILSIKIDENR